MRNVDRSTRASRSHRPLYDTFVYICKSSKREDASPSGASSSPNRCAEIERGSRSERACLRFRGGRGRR